MLLDEFVVVEVALLVRAPPPSMAGDGTGQWVLFSVSEQLWAVVTPVLSGHCHKALWLLDSYFSHSLCMG